MLGNLGNILDFRRRKNTRDLFSEEDRKSKRLTNQSRRPSSLAMILGFITLGLLGLGLRLYNIEFPGVVTFDEAYFAYFGVLYARGEYFFDIHPPMAKLVYGALVKAADFNLTDPNVYEKLGHPYSTSTYTYVRAVPAVLSAATGTLAFLIPNELGLSFLGCLLPAIFVLFDGAFHVMTTKILTDSFLWFFQAASIYFALRLWNMEDEMKEEDGRPEEPFYGSPLLRKWQWWLLVLLSGLMMGHTVSVKWTGCGVIGAIGLRQMWRAFHHVLPAYAPSRLMGIKKPEEYYDQLFHAKKKKIFRGLIGGVVMVWLITITYLFYWAIHFHTLVRHGPGSPYMSERFQSSLLPTVGSNQHFVVPENPPGFLESFIELHSTMFRLNSQITQPHPYGSFWLTWPFLYRGVLFFNEKIGENWEIQLLLGNPMGWYLATAFLVSFVGYLVYRLYKTNELAPEKKKLCETGAWLLLGYGLNYLPYSMIARTCYMYHYVPAIYWNFFMIPVFIELTLFDQKYDSLRLLAFYSVGLVVLVSWYYFCPIFYGFDVEDSRVNRMFWFRSWMW